MSSREHSQFIATWAHEARATMNVLRALPTDRFDFRPDAGGYSLGELAWHLAQTEDFMSTGVTTGNWDFGAARVRLAQPDGFAGVVEGYDRVHRAALARIEAMPPADMDRIVPFFGREMRAGDILWTGLLHHSIHHRGQLVLMCRLAGGVPPGLYGPNREEMAAMRGA